MRERAREPLLVARERRPRRRVARARPRRDDLRRVGSVAARRLRVIALEARAGQPRLDAPAPPAVARGPGTLVVARPRQRIVSPLAGDRVAARRARGPPTTMPPPTPVPRITPNTTARAPPRAVDRLRQREAVRVVADAHRRAPSAPRGRPANGRPLRHTEFEPRRSPVARDSDPGVPMPTVAAPARRPSAASASRTSGAIASSVALVVALRRGDAPAQALVAAGVERDDLDLGAAEVDAEAMTLRHGVVPLPAMFAYRDG